MTKMAAMAINRKNLKNILLQNQKAYDFETWHEASGRGALQSLYKSWTWDDLDLFYNKVNIGRPCIWMGKIVKMSFEGKNLKGKGKWTEHLWFWKKCMVYPHSGAIYMYITIIFKDLLLWNYLVNQSQTSCGAS